MKETEKTVCSIEELQEKVNFLEEEKAALEVEKAALEAENQKLSHELLHYKRLFYGRRSERRMPTVPEGQLFIPFEGEEQPLPEELAEAVSVADEIQAEARKRRNKQKADKKHPVREAIPSHIERRIRIIEPADYNPQTMEKIGEDVREVLHYTPGAFYVERIIRPIYKIKSTSKEPLPTVICQAPAVETFIPKSIAGTSLLVSIILSKYLDHLPLYRQLEIFKRHGVKLSPATINGWVHQVASRLYLLYEKMVEDILSSDYVQVDESTVPVINKEKKRADKEYIWVVHAVMKKGVFFYYDDGSRSHKTAYSILQNVRGAIQCDGYDAYSVFENKKGVLLLGCWAHARRKFESALTEDPKLANKALDYIGLLYLIEAGIKDKELSAEQATQERKRLAYPILKVFEKWMQEVWPTVLPKSLMGTAIAYAHSLYPRLVRYVADGRYHIDNNAIENVIRPLALGRKNYLFCGNHEAAKNTALFYSFFGSCKAAGGNPEEWLTDVLENINDCKATELSKFFPYNWAEERKKK